jgi:ribonuclease BN (tRNA processing enzyme)
VRLTFWGTRGSLASPGLDTVRYGGNTCCVEVRDERGDLLVLDAGTGIRRLGQAIPQDVRRVDVLLSHLHMDHIQGLGFFECLYWDDFPVHIWGPASTTMSLWARLTRYLSPPLFPVRLRELPCDLTLHDVGFEPFDVCGFAVSCSLVCHPAPTVGYRVEADGVALTYLSDHEPALGVRDFPGPPEWTSGYDLAHRADLLIHDTQYSEAEYETRVGWGHSTVSQAAAFAAAVEAKAYAPFHYDPTHDDATRDALHAQAAAALDGRCRVIPAREGDALVVTPDGVSSVAHVT